MREGTEPTDAVVANSSSLANENPNFLPASESSDGNGRRSLRRILPTCRFLSSDDLDFVSVAESAKTAEPGQLVVYRIGKDCPAKLVADAMARGAAGILTEQVLPCPLPQCIVGDIELALGHIAADDLNRPDRQLLTVAVVGSAGKTSTTLLIASLLRACGIRAGYQCDLGASDGVVQSTSTEALPTGSELVSWLGETVDSECKASIIEVSDEKARHGLYDAIEFDIVVVTGSATCNGDFGPSGLQCVLERLTSDGVVIAPGDDTRAMRVIRDTGSRMVTYGVRKAADVSAKIIEQAGGMTTLLVTHRETTAVMETSLCGASMAANHAAATLIGLLLGQPLYDVVEKLGQLRTIPGRGQRLETFGQATVVLEAGGAPERVANALRTHRSMKSGGRLWCVLAVDAAANEAHLAQFGSHLERFADTAIVTATPSSKRRFLAASHHVLDGVERCASFRLVADRLRSIEWAVREAGPRDTIVVFTNEQSQSAHDQRSDLERLEKHIESIREDEVRTSQSVPETKPVKLSIFG